NDPKRLIQRRFVAREAYPRLARAAERVRATLAPEDGEAPVGAGRTHAAYLAARPLDVAAVIAHAAAEPPADAERDLAEARLKFATWARDRAEFAADVRADLVALDGAIAKARKEIERAEDERLTAEAAETSAVLKGVAGEDVWAAHEALKRIRESAEEVAHRAGPKKRVEVPAQITGFRGHLRDYQRAGVAFLLSRDLNGILADEMGLGKTVMTLAALLAADERALVVGPANVLYNWADEVERFTGEKALVFHEREKRGPPGARVMVTTYDSLRNLAHDDPDLTSRPVLVLDEAHYVRNPETLRSKLVRSLPQKRRVLLTGTPLVNSVEDYYELLRQVDATRWGTREAFRDAWLVDATLFNRYAQVRAATATLLQRAARDVLLRRRKDEVLAELPPRTIIVNHHEFAPDERANYRRLEAHAAELVEKAQGGEAAVFAALHGLRQFIAETRVPIVEERVRELLDSGADENVVVYAHYLEPLRKLAEALGPEIARRLDGSTPPKERTELAKGLGKDYRVLLAQMESGGVGLNFTGARHVLFVHFGWTPAVHSQAMDRVHRIGQSRPVFVEFFVTPGTLDERMVRILLRKEADQNLVLADESDVINRNEIARLLAEDAKRRAAGEKDVAFSDGGAQGRTST
ncbi:MAG: DEAD/DEAH box helicase, partial [Thermoplasmatota archaeon]